MLFNSYLFIFAFLPIVLTGFYVLGYTGHRRYAIFWLVLASLAFYGWWKPAYVGLLLFSIAVNYGIGRLLEVGGPLASNAQRKALLFAGITLNLLLLGYFKYANFFVDTVNSIGGTSFHLEYIILPLAISFFTFQQIAYLVDVHRGQVCERDLLSYCLFVTFFPQLISGPIVHHQEMLPQFKEGTLTKLVKENIAVGLAMFMAGLFKKVVIADSMAVYADPVFNAMAMGQVVSAGDAWIASFAYSFQLYFDFSAYSDMAIGLGRMFGIRLPFNFNSPYKAANFFELWQRWHMTLSRFMRNHVYLPLARKQHTGIGKQLSLVFSVLLGGLWHGANWTFVVWGGLHAGLMLINHGWRLLRRALGHDLSRRTVKGLFAGIAITFLAGLITRVFFRSDNIDSAWRLLVTMVDIADIQNDLTLEVLPLSMAGGLWLLVVAAIVWIAPNTQQWLADFKPGLDPFLFGRRARRAHSTEAIQARWPRFALTRGWAVIMGIITVIALMGVTYTEDFIYFQF